MISFKKIKVYSLFLLLIILPVLVTVNQFYFNNSNNFYKIRVGKYYLPVDIRFRVSQKKLDHLSRDLISLEKKEAQAFLSPYKFNYYKNVSENDKLFFSQEITELFLNLKKQLSVFQGKNDQDQKECQKEFNVDQCFTRLESIIKFDILDNETILYKKNGAENLILNKNSLLAEAVHIDKIQQTLKKHKITSFFIQSKHIMISSGYKDTNSWDIVFKGKKYFIKDSLIFYSLENVLIVPYKEDLIIPFTLFLNYYKINELLLKNQKITRWYKDELKDLLNTKFIHYF